jgi:hypothetical protein
MSIAGTTAFDPMPDIRKPSTPSQKPTFGQPQLYVTEPKWKSSFWLVTQPKLPSVPAGLAFQQVAQYLCVVRFWSAVLRILLIFAVLIFVGFDVRDRLVPYGEPVRSVQLLDGCYEGRGLPDFIRPARHWIFSIKSGVIGDREGSPISRVFLGNRKANMTSVTFSPGILIAGKPADVTQGQTVEAKAFIRRGLVSMSLEGEAGEEVQQTSCS